MRTEKEEKDLSVQNRLLFWIAAALAPDAVAFHVDSARWLRQGRVVPETIDDTPSANDPAARDSGQAA